MPRSSSSAWLRARVRLVTMAVALHASALAAAPEGAPDALVEQGLELRRARRDDAALEAFERAYRARPDPMILAQIALAEQALGRFVEAEQHLTESLATRDAWVERHRAALATALQVVQSRLSWLEVSTNAKEAELWVDDQRRPLASSPFRLIAGPHTVVVTTPAGASAQRAVELRPGERHVYQLELAGPSAPARVAPAGRAAAPAPPVLKRRLGPEPNRPTRTWAYASAAVAGVALAEAVAASLLRQDFIDDYNGPSCAPDRSERCAAYRRSAATFGTIAIVGYAVAGAAGLTSITLFAEPWWNRSGGPAQSAFVGASGAF